MSSSTQQSTKISIDLDSASTSARVAVTHPNKTISVKHIPVTELPSIIRDSSVNFSKNSDTGFMANSLIRESIVNGQLRRLYLYPTIEFTCQYYTHLEDLEINKDNEYGITYDEDSSYLVIPNYRLRNFGLLIANTNDEKFNCARHNFGCVTTNFFDLPSNDSYMYSAMLNHFEHSVCWHASFSTSLLNERNTLLQGKLPYNYLNSNFNNDLRLDSSISEEAIQKYSDSLNTFIEKLFDVRSSSPARILRILRSNQFGKIILQYFFATIQGLKFEEYMNTSNGYSIKGMM